MCVFDFQETVCLRICLCVPPGSVSAFIWLLCVSVCVFGFPETICFQETICGCVFVSR
jgi:hypothetical protein